MKPAYVFCPARMHTVLIALSWLLLLSASAPGRCEQVELARLFYTPAQRAQLDAARLRHAQPAKTRHDGESEMPPAPVRYDGVVTRSDGKTIRWVDGRAQVGSTNVNGLKPGQVRANGQVYEPYQILRPQSVEPAVKDKDATP